MPAKTLTSERRRTARRERMTYQIPAWKTTKEYRAAMTPEVISLTRTNQRFHPFPAELFRSIFQWITDRQDLCNLCLTSRLCCTEAQYILYSVIDLAQNVQAPVLWADTILCHPEKAAIVRSLTLRFDLSFIIVPDLLLSSMKTISHALGSLPRLEKLVLVGHPRAMMHPIHTWILDGVTENLSVFHNLLFPSSAIVPFLARQTFLHEWKQAGVCPRGVITDAMLPRLTSLDGHISILASFKTPRPLETVRLDINEWRGDTVQDLEAIDSGTTLTTFMVEDSSSDSNRLTLVELLAHLSKITPKLRTLNYTLTSSALGLQDILSPSSIENLSKLGALETFILHVRRQQLCRDSQHVKAIADRTFERCTSLHYLALQDDGKFSYCSRRQNKNACVSEESIGTPVFDILEYGSVQDNSYLPRIAQTRTDPFYST